MGRESGERREACYLPGMGDVVFSVTFNLKQSAAFEAQCFANLPLGIDDLVIDGFGGNADEPGRELGQQHLEA